MIETPYAYSTAKWGDIKTACEGLHVVDRAFRDEACRVAPLGRTVWAGIVPEDAGNT
jgi:hypothetical protein